MLWCHPCPYPACSGAADTSDLLPLPCGSTHPAIGSLHHRNVSKLPVQFTLKATAPFTVQPAAVSLQPGDSASITFSFDPDFHHDLVSQTVKQRCLISYTDNPQKDWLDVSGVIDFPNLLFHTTSVDFGCVLMDSMRRVSVGLANPGKVPVEYSWSWVSQPAAGPDAGQWGRRQGMPEWCVAGSRARFWMVCRKRRCQADCMWQAKRALRYAFVRAGQAG